jgi:Tol biopolymer transport system component
MKSIVAIRTPHLRVPVIAVAAVAPAAGLAPSAQATFPGARGAIAFQRLSNPSDEDSAQIFRIGLRTWRVRQLAAFPGGSFAPDYSPHGKRIVFEGRVGDGRPDELYTMRADGSHRVRLSPGCSGECAGDNEAAWAPRGRRIVFDRVFRPIVGDEPAPEVDLVTATADGSSERLIRRFRSNREGVEPHDPQWSPNGGRLAVTLQNTAAKPEGGSAIYRLDADGRHLRRITPLSLNAGNPGLVAQREANRLQLLLRGAGSRRDLHRPPGWERAPAAAPRAGG